MQMAAKTKRLLADRDSGDAQSRAPHRTNEAGRHFRPGFDLERVANLDELLFAAAEGLDHVGIELRARSVEDDAAGRLVAVGVLVDALAGQGVEDVGQGDDSPAE